jgi:membrane fusion protein, multidrug efflux system
LNINLKGKAVVAAAVGLILIAIAFLAVKSKAKATPESPAPAEVEVAKVETESVPIYHEWIGTLTGLVNATIKAQVTGYLLRQDYKEGSYVRKGQLLFEIDRRPFQAALDQAKGKLAQAKALFIQTQAQLSIARANQLKTQLNVDKYEPLAKAQAASQQDLDDAVQTNLANKAQVQSAIAAIATAKAQIEAAQAQVETAAINLNFTRITSPISGIAGVAQGQVGDLVNAGSGPLTTVSTVNPVKDYFTVSEQEYLELQERLLGPKKKAWKLQLILADGTAYPTTGTFDFADRAVDPTTGAIQLAGLFPNPGNILRPGQYGKIRAVIQTQKDALLVPQRAVTQMQGNYQVDVVGDDNRIAVRSVEVGDQIGTMWIVRHGLHAGERVVAEGQQMLRPGTLVEPRPFVAERTPNAPADQE